jgi:hypothetical protein
MSSIGRWSVLLLLILAVVLGSDSPLAGQMPKGVTGPIVQVNVPFATPPGVKLPPGASVSAVFQTNNTRRAPAVASNPGTRNVFNFSGFGFNPYLLAAASGAYGGYGGYGGYTDGMIGAGPGVGYGSSLQGLGQYTQAEAGYWRDLQTARLAQEYARQANIDTARRRIEFEMWYDRMRPTTQRILNTESRVELDRARRVPTTSDIESGRMLNTLLKSIQKGKLSRGPNIPLDGDVLRHINLNGGSSGGNVGLLRVIDKIVWPEALREEAYEPARKRLVEDLKKAVASLKNGETPPVSLRRDLRAKYQELSDTLDKNISDLTLSQHTEALRFLRQINSAITALSDPKVVNYYNNTWTAKGRNVAELVDFMTQQGLTFAEATEGDEGAYQSLYEALRTFESGMQEG